MLVMMKCGKVRMNKRMFSIVIKDGLFVDSEVKHISTITIFQPGDGNTTKILLTTENGGYRTIEIPKTCKFIIESEV